MLEKYLLLQRARVFRLYVCQTRRDGSLISFEIVVPHLEFAKLDLGLLMLLAQLIEFTLEGRRCRIVIGLKGHELGLPLVSLCLCTGDLDLEILLGLLGALEFSFELCLELLACYLKLVELIAGFSEHVGDLIVLFSPVVRRGVAELVVVHESVPAQ